MERRAYTMEIAALMDARKQRIGEHAATSTLPWAVTALGPVPDDLVSRLEWQQRAASIGAYRELSGYQHPADPIGLEPAAGSPDLRAAWHEALAALGPADGRDVRGMPDGLLLHLRDTYPIEPPGRPRGPGMGSARCEVPPATPGWARYVPPPKPPRLRPEASTRKPPGSRNWPPATRPCAPSTASTRPRSPSP
jgi:hypothetical protein